MSGDSDNEVGAGESPVPTQTPEARGEPVYRPFKGWALAEPKPPSLWSRMRASLAGLFAKKKSADADEAQASLEQEQDAIAAQHMNAEPSAIVDSSNIDEMDVEWRDEVEPANEPVVEPVAESVAEPVAEPVADAAPPVEDAFFYPSETPPPQPIPEPDVVAEVAPEESAAIEPRRPTPTDWLERIDHARLPETTVAPESGGVDDFPPVMRVIKEKPPGFFARLFGRRKKVEAPEPEPEQPIEGEVESLFEAPELTAAAPNDDVPLVAETAEEEPLVAEAAEDLPLITEFEQKEPTLDDVLPMEERTIDDVLPVEERPAGEAPLDDLPIYEHPTSPMGMPAIEAEAELEPVRKPGFFARLFGSRRKKAEVAPEPEVVPELEPEVTPFARSDEEFAPPVVQDAYTAFEEDARIVAEEPTARFETVDDALPLDSTLSEPTPVPQAFDATLSEPPPITLPFARTLEPEAEPVSQEPFFFDAPAPPDTFAQDIGAPPVTESRDTLEVEQAERTTDEMAVVDETTGEMAPPPVPEVTPEAEAERPPFFVPKFRALYNEIVHYKQQKSEFTAGFATAIVDYHADLSADAAAQSLSARLQQILELQAAEAQWMGGEASQRYPDAQYAMAALADELFTHLDWPGKEAWPKFRLEPRLFKSIAADVEVFKRIDKLLKTESERPSPAAKDLARMYLLILAAGFQGKYRPFGLVRPLAEYRRRLYEFVYANDPLLLYGDDRRLFPEVEERTVAGRAVSRFSMLQQWAAVLVMLLIGYAVVSQIAWNRVSAELKDVTARVEAANASNNSDGVAVQVRQ